jgi:hypothetical protein
VFTLDLLRVEEWRVQTEVEKSLIFICNYGKLNSCSVVDCAVLFFMVYLEGKK